MKLMLLVAIYPFFPFCHVFNRWPTTFSSILLLWLLLQISWKKTTLAHKPGYEYSSTSSMQLRWNDILLLSFYWNTPKKKYNFPINLIKFEHVSTNENLWHFGTKLSHRLRLSIKGSDIDIITSLYIRFFNNIF